ncbi:hypothetical protein B0H67DRAFT_500434 [Lasiosphaeris hirsuta]|uniref:Uncharacterized protein n=1 Tax=Lasiosphaeris hirsuta TaxID=260670 RepID=A0AA40DIS9_9PEZI|nr:hypothetical protein B0H67DRAFT_500434 [Lasiosphaeris hirsuta]
MLHRLPDKPLEVETTLKPSKFIILIFGSTAVAGKAQLARSVASALSCALYHGDSMQESSAKAASVGSSRPTTTPTTSAGSHVTPVLASLGPNRARYQRMWLSKLTRTGLLFPEASRPATEGFSGFGGTAPSSRSTSRRGSASSFTSASESPSHSSPMAQSLSESTGFSASTPTPAKPPATMLKEKPMSNENPALMVLTHPELERWHKLSIRTAVEEYGVGVIFVPLYIETEAQAKDDEDTDEDYPILRPLDPSTMTSFPATSNRSFDAYNRGIGKALDGGAQLRIDVNADVDRQTVEVINGARTLLGLTGCTEVAEK